LRQDDGDGRMTVEPASEGAEERIPFAQVVWPFAIAETLVWACYYYSFPALLPTWEADLGFSKTTLTGAFTLSLIVAAVLAPAAGRMIDRGRGRLVFAGGAVLSAVMLILLSQVTEVWQFYVLWFFIGVGMAGSLYEPCFAILTHSMGERARRAIILVTLAAGFAGTVSFPSAHILNGFLGWRGTVTVFALVVLLICVPLILYGCHYANRNARHSAPKASTDARATMAVMRTPTFWMIGIAFTLLALDHGLIVSHMLPIMADRGMSEDTAVFAASMFGPMQVAGRLAMIAAERHVSVLVICCACFLSMSLAGISVFLATSVALLIVPFVILQGAGAGVLSIIRPTVVAELLGRKDFGVISGTLAIGFVAGSALAPTVASLVWNVGGYDMVLLLTIAIPVIALGSIVAAWKMRAVVG
jgi:MFS family permease